MSAVSRQPPPVAYTIRVTGQLDTHWAAWFEGFTLTSTPDGTTTITGSVTDQAQLHGLLAKIRDLGIALESLKKSPSPERCATAVRQSTDGGDPAVVIDEEARKVVGEPAEPAVAENEAVTPGRASHRTTR